MADVDLSDLPWFIFIICCTIFYIFVIIVLKYNRAVVPFNSTFFALWLNVAVADITIIVTIWLFYHTKRRNWWPWQENVNHFYFFIHKLRNLFQPTENSPVMMFIYRFCGGAAIAPWMAGVQFIGVTTMACNRFTSVVYPMKHTFVSRFL
jgi:hypothetical protein